VCDDPQVAAFLNRYGEAVDGQPAIALSTLGG
jgi:hypothetical protein